jgi:hypothetical protein
MTEQELRALVRQAIARHMGGQPGAAPGAGGRVLSESPIALPRVSAALFDPALARTHASHLLLNLPASMDSDGPCIIEPAVPCTHCGYCKSLGH